jgi:hypothetical protein
MIPTPRRPTVRHPTQQAQQVTTRHTDRHINNHRSLLGGHDRLTQDEAPG